MQYIEEVLYKELCASLHDDLSISFDDQCAFDPLIHESRSYPQECFWRKAGRTHSQHQNHVVADYKRLLFQMNKPSRYYGLSIQHPFLANSNKQDLKIVSYQNRTPRTLHKISPQCLPFPGDASSMMVLCILDLTDIIQVLESGEENVNILLGYDLLYFTSLPTKQSFLMDLLKALPACIPLYWK